MFFLFQGSSFFHTPESRPPTVLLASKEASRPGPWRQFWQKLLANSLYSEVNLLDLTVNQLTFFFLSQPGIKPGTEPNRVETCWNGVFFNALISIFFPFCVGTQLLWKAALDRFDSRWSVMQRKEVGKNCPSKHRISLLAHSPRQEISRGDSSQACPGLVGQGRVIKTSHFGSQLSQ